MSRRCLLVDDNAGYLSEARDLLQRQGMRVVGVASNGGDALAIAASDRPDVALVDVDLGAESGLDVARALATSDEPVAVILISAYAEKDLRELLDDSPAVGFLPKSVLSRAAIDDLLRDQRESQNLGWMKAVHWTWRLPGSRSWSRSGGRWRAAVGARNHEARVAPAGGSINVAIVDTPNTEDLARLTPSLFTAKSHINVNYTILDEGTLRDVVTSDVSAARPSVRCGDDRPVRGAAVRARTATSPT